jgi:hypothetical protein
MIISEAQGCEGICKNSKGIIVNLKLVKLGNFITDWLD